MSEYIRRQFDLDLKQLRAQIAQMGALAEQQVERAIALLTRAEGDSKEIMQADDRLDELEISIDDACAHLIAKRQPAASDLRMVLAISKIASELERVGDKARKIARLAQSISVADRAEKEWFSAVELLSQEACGLLRGALDSFASANADAALDIIRRNRLVARKAAEQSRAVIEKMVADPRAVEADLDLLNVVRALDRIADHGGDLAEHVIYILKGTDVRHASLDEIAREVGD